MSDQPAPPIERVSVTYDVAAEMMGISIDTVKRIVASGDLPVAPIRGCRVILVEDIREYVRSCRDAAAGAATARSNARANVLTPLGAIAGYAGRRK